MYELDHVALPCTSLAETVSFYSGHFGAEILYQDETWALLRLGQGKVALVAPQQHPPHLALRVDETQLSLAAAQAATPVKLHRDGTRGIYLNDPSGNVIELICYP